MNKDVVINNRDRDFFKFEETFEQTYNNYVVEHSEIEDPHQSEELRDMLSDLLIKNVKISITEKGRISKNIFGHKIKEIRHNNVLEGISVTLFGTYDDKKMFSYSNYTKFNDWYEEQLERCRSQLNKDNTSTTTEGSEKTSSCFRNVVLSINGNDYCFEGLTGVKFIIKKNDDGLMLGLERLVG